MITMTLIHSRASLGLWHFILIYSYGLARAEVRPATSIENRPCPATCTKHGNCNGETGECECRFGFGGPDCSQRLMPACHSAPDLDSSIPGVGHWYPKNCFCHKQLAEAGCPRPFYRDPPMCPYFQFWDWRNTFCYVLKGVPEDQQHSNPPDGPNDPRYQWKRGFYDQGKAVMDQYPFDLEDSGPPDPFQLLNGDRQVPQDKCPDRCNGRGWCVIQSGAQTQEPVCRCHGFYGGKACEEPLNEHCYLGCSGRGTCSGGFCHCQPGFWGLGCSRSKAYVSESWLPHPTKLKIYVYDLPDSLVYKKGWHDEPALLDKMYLAELAFMEQLLGDWTVRTENPWEANLFVINTYNIYFTGNIGFPGKHFHTVFSYIRSHFPFWNMTGGRNHVALATNDRGCCDLFKAAKQWPEVQYPIKLVHFAQAGRHSRSSPHADPSLEAALREFRRLGLHGGLAGAGGEEGSQLQLPGDPSQMSAEEESLARVRFRGIPAYRVEEIRMEREPCFRPEQDVSIPNYLDRGWLERAREAYDYSGERPKLKPLNRPYLFYFHGYTKSDMAYSGGVRQGIFAMYGNLTRPDVAINVGAGGSWMLQSRFCLAPLGYGWGIRLTQALHMGCVPVLVQDHVYTAFWDLLPYEKFSVRINRHNLHRLFDLLDAITPEQLAELQQGLADYHRHFIWHADFGGLAYNNTITSLHRRLLHMWTALFRGSS